MSSQQYIKQLKFRDITIGGGGTAPHKNTWASHSLTEKLPLHPPEVDLLQFDRKVEGD